MANSLKRSVERCFLLTLPVFVSLFDVWMNQLSSAKKGKFLLACLCRCSYWKSRLLKWELWELLLASRCSYPHLQPNPLSCKHALIMQPRKNEQKPICFVCGFRLTSPFSSDSELRYAFHVLPTPFTVVLAVLVRFSSSVYILPVHPLMTNSAHLTLPKLTDTLLFNALVYEFSSVVPFAS